LEYPERDMLAPRIVLIIAAVLGSFFTTLAGAPDTTHLAASLQRVRGRKLIVGEERRRLEDEFVKWIDTRVLAGIALDELERELGAVTMPFPEQTAETFFASMAGVTDISEQKVRGADDVFAISPTLGVGEVCALNTTILVYERASGQRIARMDGDSIFKGYFHLTGIAANKALKGESRIIATGWEHNNCASNWNGKAIRIDRVEPDGKQTSILEDGLWAYSGNRLNEVVSPWVQLDEVTFWYDCGSSFSEILAMPAIRKYRIQENQAIRETPIALSVAGFIQEWLEMPEADALP
jgi:hypothetical protein